MNYAFIGGGNMGRALTEALIRNEVCPPDQILVIDPVPECRAAASAMLCRVAERAGPEVGEARVVVLAVKPQTAPDMYGDVRPHLRAGQVVMSIMAGVTIAAIKAGLGQDAVVRVMPNTPAQVGLGMNVYYADPAVAGEGLAAVEALLRASGEALAVPAETAIDAATAISGSGPAYVFYVAEHWLRSAQEMGFTAREAERLVQQTLLGATELWKKNGVAVSTLREQVTSKGGTTAAALEYFEGKGVGAALEGGIARAHERAKELGR